MADLTFKLSSSICKPKLRLAPPVIAQKLNLRSHLQQLSVRINSLAHPRGDWQAGPSAERRNGFRYSAVGAFHRGMQQALRVVGPGVLVVVLVGLIAAMLAMGSQQSALALLHTHSRKAIVAAAVCAACVAFVVQGHARRVAGRARQSQSRAAWHVETLQGDAAQQCRRTIQAARAAVRSYLAARLPGNRAVLERVERADLQLTVYGGQAATYSGAGCVAAAALASAVLQLPLDNDMSILGALGPNGSVLPVAALERTLQATARAGMKRVIVPEGNRADWQQLPEGLRNQLRPSFVGSVDEVLDVAFGHAKPRKLSNVSNVAESAEVPSLQPTFATVTA